MTRLPEFAVALGVGALLLGTAAPAAAQRSVPLSQFGTVSQTVDTTEIRVEYYRPQARGRVLFGEEGIVRFGRTWDMGANRATNVEFSEDVVLDGQRLPAGRYSLWTTPQPEGPWPFMANSDWDVNHFPYPGEETEALRVELMPEESETYFEVLTFYFSEVGADRAVLTLHWGTTTLPIPIELAK